jgi:hypothetical protein
VSLLEHVVKILEQILAEDHPDHPDQLLLQHVLVGAYVPNGQAKGANFRPLIMEEAEKS